MEVEPKVIFSEMQRSHFLKMHSPIKAEDVVLISTEVDMEDFQHNYSECTATGNGYCSIHDRFLKFPMLLHKLTNN